MIMLMINGVMGNCKTLIGMHSTIVQLKYKYSPRYTFQHCVCVGSTYIDRR